MQPVKTYLVSCLIILLAHGGFCQHPAKTKIDSLKTVLMHATGTQRINCLNAISEELWWPPLFYPDSILYWSDMALQESRQLNYAAGIAYAILHRGVSEVYRKDFVQAETTLRRALHLFSQIQNETGIGWCKVWLGQALFSQNEFTEAFPLFAESIAIFSKTNNREGEGKSWSMLGFFYSASGNYDSSLYSFRRSLSVRQQMKDEVCVAANLTHIGHLYKAAGAKDQAINYYQQSVNHAAKYSLNYPATNWKYFIDEPTAMIYLLRQMPDSAMYFLEHALEISPENQMLRMVVSEILIARQQYDSALEILTVPIDHFKKENNKFDLARVLLNVAKAYYGKTNYELAFRYIKESLEIAEQANFKAFMADGYMLLSKLYYQKKKSDSAFYFSQLYIALKDSITNAQFLWRLTDFQNQTEFNRQKDQLLVLDSENKLKEKQLSQAAQMKWLLGIGLLIAGIASAIVYHNLNLKRKNEKLQSEKKQSQLQHHATELEMQALRAQMNPHFIFNCLNSINRFILKNESDAASNYLTKFSRLIRMVLVHSKKSFISLEEELDMLKLYLDMERLRFKDAFEYSIVSRNTVDAGSIMIPPLLLQPFVENAIWHGLMHKDGNGLLEIALKTEGQHLYCTITDDGIGRKRAAEIKSREGETRRSMGLKITKDRLTLLNKDGDHPTSFWVDDLSDENGKASGTKVTVVINSKYPIEFAES